MSNRDLNIKNINVFSISWLVKVLVIGEMPKLGVSGGDKFLEVQHTAASHNNDSGDEAEDPVGWKPEVETAGEVPTSCIIL